MVEPIPSKWVKFEKDGEITVRKKLAQGLYRPERAQQAQAWLASKSRLARTSMGNRVKRIPKSLPSLRVFLSYYHADRSLAGRVGTQLQRLGIGVFVAHDDINPSQVWQERILRELQNCHAFLLLLTRKFHTSKWTDQETGLAIEKRKVIVPLSVDVNPYGFAGRFQANRLPRTRLRRSCIGLFRNLLEMGRLRSLAVNSLINAFADSSDFIDSRDKSELLLQSGLLTGRQINHVMRVSSRNSQIYNCTPTVKNLARLIRRHKQSIDPGLMLQYGKVTVWHRRKL